jgi:hypothetical protein
MSNTDLLSHLSDKELRDKIKLLEERLYNIQISEQQCQSDLYKSKQMLLNGQQQIQNVLLNKISNPLTAPDRYYPGGDFNTQPIDNYQMIGYLYQDNERYPLFGRYKYPGKSDKWEYYIIDESRNRIKIPFKTKNDNELYDGDTVNVPTLQDNLNAKIYDIQQIRYNPNIL